MAADRGPVTFGVTILFATLATVFVAARFFTRVFLVRSVKQEDWWILAAWVVAVGFSASICVGVHYGLGLHNDDVGSTLKHVALRKAEFAFSVLYNPSLLLTKTSIIVFFLSVMSKDVDPIFKWCNWLTLALVNVGGVTLTLLNIFQCRPVTSTFIYPTPENANCTDIVTLYLSSAPLNIITDLAILFLPIPILTGMRLQRKQKIILLVTFSCGAFVAVVDVVRIASLQSASVKRLDAVDNGSSQNKHALEESDFSWYASLSFMWSAVEVNLSIICASVPMLKPLLSRFMPIFIHDREISLDPPSDLGDSHQGQVLQTSNSGGDESLLTNPAAFRKATKRGHDENDEESEISFLEMLTGTETHATKKSVATGVSRTVTHRTAQSGSDFGFVSMSNSRNMLDLSNRESLWPVAVVMLIFFLWGFAYGLLDTLNAKFEIVANISTRQGLGLHASYFGGYFFGPLTLGHYMLRKYGFKSTIMTGLCVYACGTLIFWPSAVLTSYPAFMVSNFIVAFGLSCLEIAANPYLALCGPLEYSEVRLNFAQGFQTIGTITSPLLAQKVLFTDTRATALVDVQWTYLAVAFFSIALAVVFYYIPLPEASDEQFQASADRRGEVYNVRLGPLRIVWWTLIFGVFSQWCYVGGQEVIRETTQHLYNTVSARQLHPSSLTAFDFQTISYTVYMTGRFLSAFLNCLLRPRKVLLLLYSGLVICCTLQMSIGDNGALAVNQLIYLFESGIFAQIFAITLRGMGKNTKLAAAFLTAAISGGAVFPVVQWATEQRHSLKISFVVPLVVFTFGGAYAIFLNVSTAARNQVEPTHPPRSELRTSRVEDMRYDNRPVTISAIDKCGLGTIFGGKLKEKGHRSNETTIQHIERLSEGGLDNSLQPPTVSDDQDTSDNRTMSETVQLRRPSGIIGELKPWPSSTSKPKIEKQDRTESSAEDAITRCQSESGTEEEESDYYHNFMRGR